MSLVGTLAKVALGVAIAKGVSALAKSASAAPTQANNQGGLGDLIGGMLGGGQTARSGQDSGGSGGFFDQLSDTGAAQPQQGQTGGLGDLLGGMLGGGPSGPSDLGQSAPAGQGGLGDLLGSLMGGGAAAGGLGGLIGALSGTQGNDQSLGQVLNSSFSNKGEPDVAPTPHQNAAAAVLLAAMIQAAKSDGKIQQAEKDKLLGHLTDATPAEMAFVQAQLDAAVSIPALVRNVPDGMQAQVYTMSVMAIDLDAQAEAQYLNDLAKALNLNPKKVNAIHAQLNLPALYA